MASEPTPANPSGKQSTVGEIWGGLAAMLVALPSAIAFGVAINSKLGPEYVAQGAVAGILGAIALGLLAPVFGGAPRLITAPCAPAAAVMGGLALELVAKTRGDSPALSAAQVTLFMTLVALMSGGLQFLYGAIGGGRLIKYIPFPVVSGYLSAVGLKILLDQLPKFFGFKDLPLWKGLISPDQWKWQGLLVGTVTMLGMIYGSKITKAVPAAILGLFGGILSYFALGLFDSGLLSMDNKLLIGHVAAGGGSIFTAISERWTSLGALHLADLRMLLVPALTLSVLLSIDTLKTCVIVDALTRSRHNSNRELIGQGIGNIGAAIIGGIPGAGTMGATLMNVNSGGKTRLSSILEGVFVLAAFLLLSKLIGWVPIAALAGILMIVAYRMFDKNSFHLLTQKSTALDFAVIASVIVVAVWKGLIQAAGVGVALAIFLFIREQIRGSVIRRKLYGNQISSKQHRLPAEKKVLEEYGTLTTVCELQGSLFFGTTDQLFTELEPDLKMSRYVILDMRRVQSVDFTAAHMLEQIEAMLTERGGHLMFSSLPASVPTGQDLQTYFSQVGLVKPSQNVKIFDGLDEALQWAEDSILEEHRMLQKGQEKPLELPEIELLEEFEQDRILTALKAVVKERSYRTGETIFKRGEPGDELFLIRRGIVRILLPLGNGRHHNLATFARGNFFGDMAFLERSIRSADAVATTPTDLFVISRKDFDEASIKTPLLGVKIFARLARTLAIRLRHTDNELRALQEA
ncbi:MAG: SLC26A/SulP transporter family protein [Verrucomicrobia bacterium]|nr:SLC26A/SulP transporter family protein [Verrucomicrobiota bacterium]